MHYSFPAVTLEMTRLIIIDVIAREPCIRYFSQRRLMSGHWPSSTVIIDQYHLLFYLLLLEAQLNGALQAIC